MNSIQYLHETWPRRARYTTNANRALWRELARFGGRDAADRLFRGAPGDPRNVERFCNSINMADSYFIAYEDADESIDALLLYYGSMCLARAVIYACLPFTEIDGWEPKHGITPAIDLGQRLIFLDSKLAIGGSKQTFSLVNQAFGGDPVFGRTFSIRDILASIPTMCTFIQEPFGIDPNTFEFTQSDSLFTYQATNPATGAKVGGGGRFSREATGPIDIYGDGVNISVVVGGQISGLASSDEAYLRDHIAVYPYLEGHHVKVEGERISWQLARNPSALTWEAARSAVDSELSALLVPANGTRYFAARVKKFVLPEFSLFYCLVFALSTLCRYYPDEWLQIQERQTDEHVLMRELLHNAEHRIPLLALNHLTHKEFDFITQ